MRVITSWPRPAQKNHLDAFIVSLNPYPPKSSKALTTFKPCNDTALTRRTDFVNPKLNPNHAQGPLDLGSREREADNRN